jgi:DNA-binding transcriptional LysR family regulator
MLDRLTLDQLRILVPVAETGSFSAAGRRLSRVQSAISHSVQTLETELKIALFDRTQKTPTLTDAGRAVVEEARLLLQRVGGLRARAESIANDLEPELTLAIDGAFPDEIMIGSLRSLREQFPTLPVTLFTEYFGGAEHRLRDGTARLAIFSPLASESVDLEGESLASVRMVPVVAASHQLALIKGPLTRTLVQDHVQLVLADRMPTSSALSGGILSRKIWRFADLQTRLKYLLAGFGWCNMPLHLVEAHIDSGRLKQLKIRGLAGTHIFTLYVAHLPGHPLGRAGRWLVEDLRRRLMQPRQPRSARRLALKKGRDPN